MIFKISLVFSRFSRVIVVYNTILHFTMFFFFFFFFVKQSTDTLTFFQILALCLHVRGTCGKSYRLINDELRVTIVYEQLWFNYVTQDFYVRLYGGDKSQGHPEGQAQVFSAGVTGIRLVSFLPTTYCMKENV